MLLFWPRHQVYLLSVLFFLETGSDNRNRFHPKKTPEYIAVRQLLNTPRLSF